MSQAEIDEALRAIARLRLPVPERRTRRYRPARRGPRVDFRASLRRALRPEGLTELRQREPRRRPPPLVILCDISGSMARYTRMFLHFMHAHHQRPRPGLLLHLRHAPDQRDAAPCATGTST